MGQKNILKHLSLQIFLCPWLGNIDVLLIPMKENAAGQKVPNKKVQQEIGRILYGFRPPPFPFISSFSLNELTRPKADCVMLVEKNLVAVQVWKVLCNCAM